MEKLKSVLTVAICAALLAVVLFAQLLLPDAAVSVAERRKLAQMPTVNSESVLSGEFSTDLETYLLDQFPLRDAWRTVKAYLRFGLFRQLDNNGIYLSDGSVFKRNDPLDEKQVTLATDKINAIVSAHLGAANVYWAMVPDKNYYADAGYPGLDYDALTALLRENLADLTEVPLQGSLTLDDYYRTDPHWRQESLYPVVVALATAMDVPIAPMSDYTAHTLSPFYGAFCGQSALPVEPDALTYLTSAATDGAVVTSAEQAGTLPVYPTEKFEGMDGYDVFLSGAAALLTIENPNAKTDRELIIFRDSFGSSLAPYFIDSYAKITLVDLRYVASALLPQLMEFGDQDVLFLYSTLLLNSGSLLK
ncbi:MAG: DHHW family protein [Oscillospiraceae bacterium]|nr:DHHW family protein [Oscillospiraceae bacterium]